MADKKPGRDRARGGRGTVGDYESTPSWKRYAKCAPTSVVITVFRPRNLSAYIAASQELKTKPTQHSVRELRSIGIQPDVIIARADHPIPAEHINKISLFCDVPPEAVIPAVTSDILYNIPLLLEETELAEFVAAAQPGSENRAGVGRVGGDDRGDTPPQAHDSSCPGWQVRRTTRRPHERSGGALPCRYQQRPASRNRMDLPGDLERGDIGSAWRSERVVVPGGFGERGIEGKIKEARWARENKVPYLGLCLGMQVMCIELPARCWATTRPTTEFDRNCEHPVISLMPDQQ